MNYVFVAFRSPPFFIAVNVMNVLLHHLLHFREIQMKTSFQNVNFLGGVVLLALAFSCGVSAEFEDLSDDEIQDLLRTLDYMEYSK